MAIDGVPLSRVLFQLAARAPHLSRQELLERLTTALANHYFAIACNVHVDTSGWPKAAAEPVRAVRKMAPVDRARRETIEARLVKAAVGRAGMSSAQDLEGRAEVSAFFERTLGIVDMFAFPLQGERGVAGVLVLYLSLDSEPLRDADIHGLLGVGELLALARPDADALSA